MGSRDWMSGRRRAPRVARTRHQRLPLLLPPPPRGPSILPTKRWLLLCTRPNGSSLRDPSRHDRARHRHRGLLFPRLPFQSVGTLPAPPGRLPCRSHWSQLGDTLTPKSVRGRGVRGAQSVEPPTSAQVTLPRFTSSSPASGSVPMARSPEPASDSASPPLSLRLPYSHSVSSLSLSQK